MLGKVLHCCLIYLSVFLNSSTLSFAEGYIDSGQLQEHTHVGAIHLVFYTIYTLLLFVKCIYILQLFYI